MASGAVERSPSSRATSAVSTSAPARKRSGKKLVKGPRQPRLTHSPNKDGSVRPLSSLVEEQASERSTESQNGSGPSAMSVDMEAVSQVDATAVRVEALHELMMYIAQVMRENGMVAREQLRLTMLSRGDEVNLPETPAIDSGFVGGPASRLLGVAFGSPPLATKETAPPAAPPAPEAPRPESRQSSPLHAPTPIMGTINDPAKHLEDIVDDSIPPPPPPQLPASMHLQEPPKQIFSPPIPTAPHRPPSAMPSYGGEVTSPPPAQPHASAPAPPAVTAPPAAPQAQGPATASATSTPAVQTEVLTTQQSQQRTAGYNNPGTYPSVQSLAANALYYPMTNPYTNGMGRYPPFVQSQYPQASAYNVQSSSSNAQNYMAASQTQARNSWAGYPTAPTLSSVAPQHAPTQQGYSSAADSQRTATQPTATTGYPSNSYPSATSTAPTTSHPQYPSAQGQPGQPSMMIPRQYADRSSWSMPSLASFGASTEQPNPWPHTA